MSKEMYERALSNGMDYNYFGKWQQNYAKMVMYLSRASVAVLNNSKNTVFLDVGTACGVILKAFKELELFQKCIGIDKSEYMINIGKEKHKLSNDELVVCDISKEKLPVDDKSVILLHCSHTLEFIEEEYYPHIFKEFKRVLHPNGIGLIILPAAKRGLTVADIKENSPSNKNVHSELWWNNQLAKYFNTKQKKEINARFKSCKFSPTDNDKTFYDNYSLNWSILSFAHKK
jgi:ubiquinone/menaquinone biosynthesis C-methylase UbiE